MSDPHSTDAKRCEPGRCAYGNFCCPNGCKDTVELDTEKDATITRCGQECWRTGRCDASCELPDTVAVPRLNRDAGHREAKYQEALRQIARTPSRDWHLNARIAREALNGD